VIRPRRHVAAMTVAGALLLAPALSACGAGETPQTAKPTQLTEGVNIQIPTDVKKPALVAIRNLFVLGPPAGSRITAGTSVPVYADLINNAPAADRLVSATSPTFSGGSEIGGGGVELPPGKLVPLSGTSGPLVVVKGLTQNLYGGESIQLTLTFANAGSVQTEVPVIPQTGEYETYSAAPSPTPTTQSPSPTTTGSPTATGSPTTKPAKATKKATASPTP